jgi:hypothetical protein
VGIQIADLSRPGKSIFSADREIVKKTLERAVAEERGDARRGIRSRTIGSESTTPGDRGTTAESADRPGSSRAQQSLVESIFGSGALEGIEALNGVPHHSAGDPTGSQGAKAKAKSRETAEKLAVHELGARHKRKTEDLTDPQKFAQKTLGLGTGVTRNFSLQQSSAALAESQVKEQTRREEQSDEPFFVLESFEPDLGAALPWFSLSA